MGSATGKAARGDREFQSVMGWARSGLTQACVDRYWHLLQAGANPARILFLVRSRRQGAEVLRRLQALSSGLVGPWRIETFLQRVGRALAEYWPQVCARVPQLPRSFEPVPLAKDLTQFLCGRVCALCPRHGEVFANLGLDEFQIWDQISSAAYIAGASGLTAEAVGSRLAAAWPEDRDPARAEALGALSCCVEQLWQAGLQLGSLDFGLQLRLFQEHILPLAEFWQEWDHLIVDQAEDSCGVALEFYRQGQAHLQSQFFSYTLGGGISLTAIPETVACFLLENTQVRFTEGSYCGSAGLVRLGLQIARAVAPQFSSPLPEPALGKLPRVEVLEGETPFAALEAMVAQIRQLLDAGIPAFRLAVLLPCMDAGVSLSLQEQLPEAPILPIAPFPALIRYPLVRALLTAAEVAHPQWGAFPTLPAWRLLLSRVLDLDPIRAALLAEDTLDPVGRSLRPRTAVRQPERVGFANLERYQRLLDWLRSYRPGPSLAAFFQRFFAEHLTTASPQDQELLQLLTDAAQRFRRAFPTEEDPAFLAMIRSGQSPSNSRFEPDYSRYLVVATPAAYIQRGLEADYQFWFDITNPRWSRSLWRGLYNSRVLTPEWEGGVFDTAQDREARQQILARTLLNLCCRARQGLWLVRSTFNGRGEENTGTLDLLVLKAAKAIACA
ncbi:hypothetical protein [Synechococcus sp. H65.1]|uniref:hypothetical protein n=1 Tax=unclassified Synechococcus TaxID=2626047 RepID=UPI0039C3563A